MQPWTIGGWTAPAKGLAASFPDRGGRLTRPARMPLGIGGRSCLTEVRTRAPGGILADGRVHRVRSHGERSYGLARPQLNLLRLGAVARAPIGGLAMPRLTVWSG